MASMTLSACGGTEREIKYEPPSFERYENHIEIEGQWGASAATGENGQYGIGDPFVLRHNGKYYLYPSTSDPCDGIKVFESDDLIHWKDRGFAVRESEKTVHGAYAPEVVYYDGYFYLCQSRAGQGHYIYRSESPTEGFELVSTSNNAAEGELNYGNLGMGIDGAFFVSDEGKLYLMHTSTPAGLRFNEITDVENISSETIGETGELGQASLGGWIEGPGVFRRGTFSYLTYTGNHVISHGYRIGYSYAENMTSLEDFVQPTDNITIMDTSPQHRGLGHSSNTVGPDLDSVYTAYHNLVGGGPARRYNVDRYLASGGILTANGVTHAPVSVPKAPDGAGYGDALTLQGGVYSIGKSGQYFTAEFNYVPMQGQALHFGQYTFTLEGGMARLAQNGKTVCEKQVQLTPDKLVCVRVEQGDGVGYVHVNGMRVLTYEASRAGGEVGYARREGVGYTAFSNDVFGTSDFEALKNFPTKFPATGYLKGENRGFSIAGAKRVSGGVRVGERERMVRVDDRFAVSLSKGDWVKYAVDVLEAGTYHLAAEVTGASSGAKVRVSMGEQAIECTIPAVAEETERVSLGTIALEKGVTTMRVEVLSGKFQPTLFESLVCGSGQVSLDKYTVMRGGATHSEEGLHVQEGSAVLFDGSDAVNFTLEAEFSCAAAIDTDFGIMLRAAHYSDYPHQPAQSWRGYYLQFSPTVFALRRYDYSDTGVVAIERTGDVDLTGGRHSLAVRVQGNAFEIRMDGKVVLSGKDACAFFGGYVGIYTGRGDFTLHSLNFQRITETL